METSLLFKTFLILGVQLSLVFGACLLVIRRARLVADQGEACLGVTFTTETNERGELDLQPVEESQGLTWITWFCIICMFSMVFTAPYGLTWGLVTMTLTSLSLGPLIGMIMLSMDENDGLRALQLTVLITFGAALVGMYFGVDFSGMAPFLCIALLVLIIFRLVMLFTGFATGRRRLVAVAGAGLFVLFLLYDFNQLAQLNAAGVDDWETALDLAISLYLDIINLLLEILEALGD